MNFIVGLGNPGQQYNNTYHNLGFMALDWLTNDEKEWQSNKKFNGLVYKAGEVNYLKPQTFMNNSGQSVVAALSYFKLLPKSWGVKKKNVDLTDALTVIHDDVDIPLGKIKIADNSSSGGHRGVESIIRHLKTKNFIRIRIGIKMDTSYNIPTEKFVLKKIPQPLLDQIKTAWQKMEPEIKEKIGL